MHRLGALFALLLCASVAAAPAARHYWLVLASFQQRDAAERFVTLAASDIPEPLDIRLAITPDGRDLYRVAVGPYESTAAAEERAASLRNVFPDAWIMATTPFEAEPPSVAAEPPEPETSEEEQAREPLRIPETPPTGFNRLYRRP